MFKAKNKDTRMTFDVVYVSSIITLSTLVTLST